MCVLQSQSFQYPSLPEVRGKGQNNDEHDDWSSSNQRWSRCDGNPSAAGGSQMAASAAQAAEQVALNAHITLRELKGMIDTVVEKKLPTFKTLMEMNPVAVARTSVNGAKLTAYENGYAVYEVDSAHTVMAVDRCGDYRYDFTDGTHQIVPAETFEDAEWSLRLLMEGEKRMEHNLSKTAAKFEQVPLECDGSDWSASIMVDFLDEDNAEMLADRELRRLYAAMSKLTERQMEVVQLYFYKGMTQQEIAEEIGIGRRSVGNCLEGALKKIRKNF
jgi:RNA polymerase sigma factor (sigma-70 family)